MISTDLSDLMGYNKSDYQSSHKLVLSSLLCWLTLLMTRPHVTDPWQELNSWTIPPEQMLCSAAIEFSHQYPSIAKWDCASPVPRMGFTTTLRNHGRITERSPPLIILAQAEPDRTSPSERYMQVSLPRRYRNDFEKILY